MERIFIKNFKAIQNTEDKWIDIDRLTVFFGEQASGKSTVAKLVYFFKTIPNEVFFEILQNNTINEINFDERLNQRLRRYFVLLFGSTRHLENFKIHYEYPTKNQIDISKDRNSGNLRIGNRNSLWTALKNICLQIRKKLNDLGINPQRLDKQLIYDAENQRIIFLFLQKLKEIFGEKLVVFMPASRNISVSLDHHFEDIYSKLDRSMLTSQTNHDSFQSENELIIMEFIKYAKNLKSIFQKGGSFEGFVEDERLLGTTVDSTSFSSIIHKFEKILKGKYVFDQYGEKIYFADNKYVFVGNASSGQQESLRLLQDVFVTLVRQEKVCKIYEEPESHLFPQAQKLLIEAMSILIKKNPNSQIIIPTHSPYILTALNNLLYASLTADEQKEKTKEIDPLVSPFERFEVKNGRILGLKVYFFGNGEIKNIIDHEDQLILGNYLDGVSEELSDVFHQLMRIRHD